jgi:hypothetical protein
MQNPSSWGTVPSGGARQNPAAAARAPPRSQLAVQGAGASGVAAGNGLTLPGRQGKSRKKVVLNPGHSPLDWARLQKSGINLRVCLFLIPAPHISPLPRSYPVMQVTNISTN